jgi:hypothetical protein
MTTKMCAGVLGVVLALGAVLPASATGVEHYDSNLERWAKQRIAAKMGDLRDGIDGGEAPLFVTWQVVSRGLVPLNQLPTDGERALFAAFGISEAYGFNFPHLELRPAPEPDQADPVMTASVSASALPQGHRPYAGAFVTAGH